MGTDCCKKKQKFTNNPDISIESDSKENVNENDIKT